MLNKPTEETKQGVASVDGHRVRRSLLAFLSTAKAHYQEQLAAGVDSVTIYRIQGRIHAVKELAEAMRAIDPSLESDVSH